MAIIPQIFIDTPRLFLYMSAPIILDFGIYKIASGKMWKYAGSTAVGLGAIFVLSRYSPHYRLIAYVYSAYKAILLWSTFPWSSSKPHEPGPTAWNIEDARLAALQHPYQANLHLAEKFSELKKHLKIEYPHPWTGWKDLNAFANSPETRKKAREGWDQHWKEALEVIQEAAARFEELRLEIWRKFEAAPSEEERLKQIAEFLQRDNTLKGHSMSYSGMNVKELPTNLLEIYRFIRSTSYKILYKNSQFQSCTKIYTIPGDLKRTTAFDLQLDTPEYKMRGAYNKAIEKWLPILDHLPPDSPYKEWLQQDQGAFNLNPPPLPSF